MVHQKNEMNSNDSPAIENFVAKFVEVGLVAQNFDGEKSKRRREVASHASTLVT